MVDSFRKILHAPLTSLNQAAFVLAFSSLISQVLALLRDRTFAHLFGAGTTLDVYYASFKVPDFLFVTIASLVSMTVLIPYFSREYAKDKEAARVFLDSVFTIFIFLLLVASAVAFLLIPKLSFLVAPGFNAAERAQYIVLSRILLLSPLFLGISGHVASISQSFHRFIAYALSPVLYNAGIIFGAVFFYPHFGLPGLGLGVAIGALMHLAIQWPTVVSTGFRPRFIFPPLWKRVREVFVMSVPRTITLGTTSLAALVLTSIASLLAVGSISVYNLSFNLQSVPLSIIGVSFSMAALPTLSGLFAKRDLVGFRAAMEAAARQIIFWSFPATALFVVLRAQVVRVILGSGQFDWTATRLTAAALALFTLSLVAQSLVLLFVRGYYAAGRTRTPLISNVVSAVAIVILAPLLIYSYRHAPAFANFINGALRVEGVPGSEVLMLPLAYTLGLFLNLFLHWIDFRRDYGFLSFWAQPIRQSLLVALVSGSVGYVALGYLDEVFNINTLPGIFMQGLLAGILAIAVGVALLWSMKNEEFLAVISAARSRILRTTITLPPTEENIPQ